MSMTVANGCLQPSLSQVLSISLPQQPIRNTMKIPIRNDAVVRTIWSHLHGYDCSNTKPELYRIPLHERNGFAGTESDGNVQSIKLRYCKCGNDGRTYPDREIHLLQPIPDPSQRKSARIQGHACKSGGVCLHELCKRKPLRPEHQAIGALQSA